MHIPEITDSSFQITSLINYFSSYMGGAVLMPQKNQFKQE